MTYREEYYTSSKTEKEMPQTVYHYCSVQTLISIIENNSIRLSNITKSNDSSEITYVIPAIQRASSIIIEHFNNMLSEEYRLSPDVMTNFVKHYLEDSFRYYYVICFSEARNLLSQWARYADDSRGVAIGFNTRPFVKLQLHSGSQYVFGKIVYGSKPLRDFVYRTLYTKISSGWKEGCDSDNVVLIENEISSLIFTILQHSVLFKHPFFQEEKEWRLVFNPLGMVRRIKTLEAYMDYIISSTQGIRKIDGFLRGNYGFKENKEGEISSFVDLDFSEIRRSLIQEIIIGPKSALEPIDKDLQLFLRVHGYRPTYCSRKESVVIEKPYSPLR